MTSDVTFVGTVEEDENGELVITFPEEMIAHLGWKEGDEIEVKLLDIDPKTGKFKLSHKVLLPKPEAN